MLSRYRLGFLGLKPYELSPRTLLLLAEVAAYSRKVVGKASGVLFADLADFFDDWIFGHDRERVC